MKIGVTGSTGFIGTHLLPFLTEAGHSTRQIARSDLLHTDSYIGCETVVHLVGVAAREAITDFEEVNNRMAVGAALAARSAGVQKFVFISTAFAAETTDAYSRSKANAEHSLQFLDGIEIVILRPSLVYGAGVKGNLRALLKLCRSRAPLPFAGVSNKRSMVGVTNLASAIEFSATTNNLAATPYAVVDCSPSIADLIILIRDEMNLPHRLFSVPPQLLYAALAIKPRWRSQLMGNFVVDSTPIIDAGWVCQVSQQRDLHAMVHSMKGSVGLT